MPDTSLDEVMDETFDMMVLPGGVGADRLDADPRVHELLKRHHQQGRYIAAICAAPKVLANAGLLDGRRATSYPGVLDKMDLPRVYVELERVISDDRVITSRGPGTAMDFALELIEKLSGRETRDQVEQGLVR